MLRFFRHVRKRLIIDKSITKYLLYALGEILLVMVGILLALQVNNWNNKKQDREEYQVMLKNLSQDLLQDKESLEQLQHQLNNRIKNANLLLQTLATDFSITDSTAVFRALYQVGWIFNFQPAFATYNEILNSGKLGIIPASDLKKELAGYKTLVDTDKKIIDSYTEGLKLVEKLSINTFKETVPLQTASGKTIAERKVEFDLETLRNNPIYHQELRHIIYHSGIEIDYIKRFILSRIERLQNIIEKEMD